MISETSKVYSIQVQGIKCTNCAQKISDGLNQVIDKKNSKISINILQEKISFTTTTHQTQKQLAKIKTKLQQLGYPCVKQPYLVSGGNQSHRNISFVVPITTQTQQLEQNLRKVMGIIKLQRVHQYSNLRFNIVYQCETIKGRQIADYLKTVSQFKVINQRVQSFQSNPKLHSSEHSLWLTAFLCLYFLFANMILPFTGEWYMDFATFPKSMSIFTPFVLLNTVLGIYVFDRYAKAIVLRAYYNYLNFSSTDMQTLIGLGTLSALTLWAFFVIEYSVQIISGQVDVKVGSAIMDINDALTSSSIIVLVVTIGRHLQHQVKIKIQKMTQQIFPESTLFANMTAKFVELKNRNLVVKDIREYDVSLLQKNDIIQIQQGRLLLDIIILSGKVKASQSATTGCEDIIQLCKGDRIQSGAMIHSLQTQQCLALIQNVFEKGILIQIGTQVKLAQNQEQVNTTGIQAVCKSIASIFVKSVILLSLSTMIIWTILIEFLYVSVPKCTICWVMERGIGVLVASCPCALGLAVPSVIAIVLNLATKSGILIKNNAVFQKMKKCKIISFDKTGTLFTKMNNIQQYHIFRDKLQESKLWEIIAIIQKQLRHPLAELLYKESLRKSNITGTNFNFILLSKPKTQKQGISAQVKCKFTNQQYKVLIGNKNILKKNKIQNQYVYNQTTEAATQLFLTLNSEVHLVMFINTHSNLRPQALQVIQKIQKQGQQVHILSGDSKQSVIKLANYLKIPNKCLHSQHSSVMKTDWIKTVQLEGKEGVMMIGDGLNDIPCLQEAAIGVSINAKSQLNINAADIIILSQNLHKILALIRLLNKGNLFININLFWAFAYNLIIMPVVAGAFYKYDVYISPIWSSIAMSMSSVIVVAVFTMTIVQWQNETFLSLVKVHCTKILKRGCIQVSQASAIKYDKNSISS